MMARKVSLSVGTPWIWLRARPSHANRAPHRSAQTIYPITGCCATPTSSGYRDALGTVYHCGCAIISLRATPGQHRNSIAGASEGQCFWTGPRRFVTVGSLVQPSGGITHVELVQ